MQKSLSSFYIMHSLLQCLVCCQHIIHWHCDLNSSLLSTTWGDVTGGEKAALGGRASGKICLTSAKDIFLGKKTTNQTNHFCFLLFSFFKQDSWYFTWGPAHEEIVFRLMALASLSLVAFWWWMLHHLCWFIILLQVRLLLWLSYCCCRDKGWNRIFWHRGLVLRCEVRM